MIKLEKSNEYNNWFDLSKKSKSCVQIKKDVDRSLMNFTNSLTKPDTDLNKKREVLFNILEGIS